MRKVVVLFLGIALSSQVRAEIEITQIKGIHAAIKPEFVHLSPAYVLMAREVYLNPLIKRANNLLHEHVELDPVLQLLQMLNPSLIHQLQGDRRRNSGRQLLTLEQTAQALGFICRNPHFSDVELLGFGVPRNLAVLIKKAMTEPKYPPHMAEYILHDFLLRKAGTKADVKKYLALMPILVDMDKLSAVTESDYDRVEFNRLLQTIKMAPLTLTTKPEWALLMQLRGQDLSLSSSSEEIGPRSDFALEPLPGCMKLEEYQEYTKTMTGALTSLYLQQYKVFLTAEIYPELNKEDHPIYDVLFECACQK